MVSLVVPVMGRVGFDVRIVAHGKDAGCVACASTRGSEDAPAWAADARQTRRDSWPAPRGCRHGGGWCQRAPKSCVYVAPWTAPADGAPRATPTPASS